MSAGSGRPALLLQVLLQLVTIALLAVVFREVRSSGAGDDEEMTSSEELVGEITQARYQLKNQADRLTRLLDKVARGELAAAPANAARAPAGDEAPRTPSELLDELARVTDVHSRYKHDPLQREPVEEERARLEEQLRGAGDDTVDALVAFFPSLPQVLEDAEPTWMQTRLLSHVVAPIGTDAAIDFARSVFEDPSYNSGVRLQAARVTLPRDKDEVHIKLIELLQSPDPSFSRPEQIALYFRSEIDPRAIPALIEAARDTHRDQLTRRFALEALSEYDDPRVIEALKDVATHDTAGDLRGLAIVGLNQLLGKDVVGFVEFLRERMEPEDPLHTLLDNTEALWVDAN